MTSSPENVSEMSFDLLARTFLDAVAALRVDGSGVWCHPHDADRLNALARAVQIRSVRIKNDRDRALGMSANIIRVILNHPAMQRRPSGDLDDRFCVTSSPQLSGELLSALSSVRAESQ